MDTDLVENNPSRSICGGLFLYIANAIQSIANILKAMTVLSSSAQILSGFVIYCMPEPGVRDGVVRAQKSVRNSLIQLPYDPVDIGIGQTAEAAERADRHVAHHGKVHFIGNGFLCGTL